MIFLFNTTRRLLLQWWFCVYSFPRSPIKAYKGVNEEICERTRLSVPSIVCRPFVVARLQVKETKKQPRHDQYAHHIAIASRLFDVTLPAGFCIYLSTRPIPSHISPYRWVPFHSHLLRAPLRPFISISSPHYRLLYKSEAVRSRQVIIKSELVLSRVSHRLQLVELFRKNIKTNLQIREKIIEGPSIYNFFPKVNIRFLWINWRKVNFTTQSAAINV